MQTTSSVLSLLAEPQWLALVLITFWLLGAALLARIAGWSSLARQFAAPEVPEGQGFRFVSGSLGSPHWPIKYRNCLRVVVSSKGLYISPMFLFKFRSPALLLPWHSIESVQEKQMFATRTVTFRFRDQWSALSLSGSIGQLARSARDRALDQNAP